MIKIKIMSKNYFKNFVKKRTKEAAFEYLNILKKKHSKVEFIEHASLKIIVRMKNVLTK